MTRTGYGLLPLLMAATFVTDAVAGGRDGVHLGRPRTLGDGTLAVPVQLRAPKGVHVAALNFTLRWDSATLDLAPRGVAAGAAVQRANAELASQADAATGTLRAIVVPEFRAGFGALQTKRLATIYLKPRGRMPGSLRRWVQRHVELSDVVLGDPDGRELHLRTAGKGR